MPLALSTPIFNKKYDRTRTVELLKLPIVETLLHSTACVECDFLLKIGVLRAKGITKNAPNFEVCDLTLVRSTTLFINVVIVVLY